MIQKLAALLALALSCVVAVAQTAPTTTPVTILAGEPLTMVDGTPVRPNWFVFYNLYQAPLLPAVPATTTTPAIPATPGTYVQVAGQLLPGQTYVVPVKGGSCFSISAFAFYALDTPIMWHPMESAIAPGGCKAVIAGATTFTVTLVVQPW